MENKIIVEIDEELSDIAPGYLQNRFKELPVLKELLIKQDYNQLSMLGHKIRGSAGGYGFNYIGTIGAILEDSAKEKNSHVLEAAVKELEDYLNILEIVYVKTL